MLIGKLVVYNEVEEATSSVTARNVITKSITEEPNIQEHVQYISSELQNVLSECISEQGHN